MKFKFPWIICRQILGCLNQGWTGPPGYRSKPGGSILTDFLPNIDKKILQEQLIDFALKWDSLSKT
ncbi:hypothetical protein QTP88_010765 [Uroleucon formosanum]